MPVISLPINGMFEYVEYKSLLISIWIACNNFRTPLPLSGVPFPVKWSNEGHRLKERCWNKHTCMSIPVLWMSVANEKYGYGNECTFNTTILILDGPIHRIPWFYLCIFCISKTLNCEHQQASWKYSSKNEFHFYLIATVCLTLTKLK